MCHVDTCPSPKDLESLFYFAILQGSVCHASPQHLLRELQAPGQAAQAGFGEGGGAGQTVHWALALRPSVMRRLGRVLSLAGGEEPFHPFLVLVGLAHLLFEQLAHLGVIQLIWCQKNVKALLEKKEILVSLRMNKSNDFPSSSTICHSQFTASIWQLLR